MVGTLSLSRTKVPTFGSVSESSDECQQGLAVKAGRGSQPGSVQAGYSLPRLIGLQGPMGGPPSSMRMPKAVPQTTERFDQRQPATNCRQLTVAAQARINWDIKQTCTSTGLRGSSALAMPTDRQLRSSGGVVRTGTSATPRASTSRRARHNRTGVPSSLRPSEERST